MYWFVCVYVLGSISVIIDQFLGNYCVVFGYALDMCWIVIGYVLGSVLCKYCVFIVQLLGSVWLFGAVCVQLLGSYMVVIAYLLGSYCVVHVYVLGSSWVCIGYLLYICVLIVQFMCSYWLVVCYALCMYSVALDNSVLFVGYYVGSCWEIIGQLLDNYWVVGV